MLFQGEVDADVVGRPLILRRPQAGDRFRPLGLAGSKKLQDLFVDEKVPRALRAHLPVLASPQGILWVAGRHLADWAKVHPGTQRVWRLSFVRDDVYYSPETSASSAQL